MRPPCWFVNEPMSSSFLRKAASGSFKMSAGGVQKRGGQRASSFVAFSFLLEEGRQGSPWFDFFFLAPPRLDLTYSHGTAFLSHCEGETEW